MSIVYYTLHNGVTIPSLGFGTYKLQDTEQARDCVAYALRAGYRSIDTAALYKNETGVGQGIRESGLKREDIFVTTKLPNDRHGYDEALRTFDESMARLGLDYLDLYLIHWPGKDRYVKTWKAFEKLYREGRIRAIGVSNFLPHHLETLRQQTEIMPMVNQIELHPYLWQREAINYCQGHGILVEAWSPLMRGGAAFTEPTVSAIAQKHGKTNAQVILRWELQHGIRVIPKSATPARILENSDLFSFELDQDDMAAIDALERAGRTGAHPDEFLF
ncbi:MULTISPECIES: aldo/keto reductase [unclassified Clostridium]|uniref:aldo/keto reductase n=1 Tax=unclassified Clostridium TaxID=2614128 RepID=UPI001106C8ED|nr:MULTISPECIES: aldo/keto reductase [unclassified Clostridium]